MKKFDPAVYKKRKCECLDKCFQAFMDNGLENTGLQLLCKYCGFKTNQALYHYFESKDMIITESVQYAMIKFEREFMKKAPRSRADLKNYLEKFPRWMQKNYGEHMRFVYQVYTSPKYKKQGYDFFSGIPKRYDTFIHHIAKNLDVSFESIQALYYLYITSTLQFALFKDEVYLDVEVNAIYNMCLEVFERAAQQLHDRLVYAENDAEHAAGYAGQHGSEADKHALYEALGVFSERAGYIFRSP